jgi:hypothetical protein
MSWRGKYVGWYRIMGTRFGDLLPELSDQDILESVAPEDVLIVPTIEEDKPRNQRKHLPHMSLILKDDSIETRITYTDRESLELLRNIFKDTQRVQLKSLFGDLQALDPGYETLLYSKTRDEPKQRLIRKYVSARLDQRLIERMIDETESLRRGGRQAQHNGSAYVHPESPEVVLVRRVTPLDQGEFLRALDRLQPIYKTLTRVKTQREMISARLSTPRRKRNQYREFIELLNEAHSGDYISAERRRKLNDRWRKDEDSREDLIEELRELLNK